jgi:outer membrane protein OmpA-like peptidoglycan-associated protein
MRDPADDLEDLRRLLISPEQADLRQLHERLEDKEQRAKDVASILPEAIKLSRGRSEELSRALRPAVEGSIRESIETRPQIFIDALHPIIGSVVRRSLAESLRGLLQSMNQTLEHTFSWKGLKWRFEALRTGKSFAEIVMLRSLVFRVEQIFLIHRETSLSLLHVSADDATAQDSDMVAGMLSAIQDFARDSFHAGKDAALEEFRVGELQVWIAAGSHAYLAAVIRGNPPRELRTSLEQAIEGVHILKGSALANFEGDAVIFESVRPELEACLRAQYETEKKDDGPARVWFAWMGAAALLLFATLYAIRSEYRWHDFLRRLNAEPGIAVTHSNKGWLFASMVGGLRDPSSTDPAAVARDAKVNPDAVRFEWRDYLALDTESVVRHFTQRFGQPPGANFTLTSATLAIAGSVPYEWVTRVRQEATHLPGINAIDEKNLTLTYDPALVFNRFQEAFPPPPGVTAKVENGTLVLAGTAPYEWAAPVRTGATKIPGINAISEERLQVSFDPKLVLQRFVEKFGLPDSVNAVVQKDALVISGEASHAWITRVRPGATSVPGIKTLDDRSLIDLDQRTFQQSKSVIENAFVYFLVNKDNFATEGFAALSRLPDEIRRFLTAAKRLGIDTSIEIRGYADSVGSEASNVDLSRRRAEAVRDFLVSCGFEAGNFKPLGLGAPPKTEKPLPEQSDRRVAFHIVTAPAAATP